MVQPPNAVVPLLKLGWLAAQLLGSLAQMGSEEQMHSCYEVGESPAEFDRSRMNCGISFWLVGKDKDLSDPNVSHIIIEITSLPVDF